MRLFHSLAKTYASFDDPNLVSQAGLVPVMALAQRAGLGDLVAEHVTPDRECGVNAHLKVPCLAAGMAAGADSIDDMDLFRHGAMDVLFGGRGHLTLHLPEGWHREQEWLILLARGLRAARRRGLTSPEPVSTPTAPRPPRPRPRARNPGQAAPEASGRTPAPGITSQNSSRRNQAGNELPELAGGSRLRSGIQSALI